MTLTNFEVKKFLKEGNTSTGGGKMGGGGNREKKN